LAVLLVVHAKLAWATKGLVRGGAERHVGGAAGVHAGVRHVIEALHALGAILVGASVAEAEGLVGAARVRVSLTEAVLVVLAQHAGSAGQARASGVAHGVHGVRAARVSGDSVGVVNAGATVGTELLVSSQAHGGRGHAADISSASGQVVEAVHAFDTSAAGLAVAQRVLRLGGAASVGCGISLVIQAWGTSRAGVAMLIRTSQADGQERVSAASVGGHGVSGVIQAKSANSLSSAEAPVDGAAGVHGGTGLVIDTGHTGSSGLLVSAVAQRPGGVGAATVGGVAGVVIEARHTDIIGLVTKGVGRVEATLVLARAGGSVLTDDAVVAIHARVGDAQGHVGVPAAGVRERG
jgi:hypothetical protein